MSPLLLSPEAARQQLGVSERGFRDLLKKGLPYIKVGKRRMFPANDLATWVSEQAKCSAPAPRTGSTGGQTRRTGGYAGRSTVISFDEAVTRTTKT
jgi:hypothetical protein